MRIIRCKNSLTAILSGGRIIQTGNCIDETFELIKKYQEEDNEFELINLLIPEVNETSEQKNYRTFFINVIEKALNSNLLEVKNNDIDKSMYWPSVSPLSLPPELADRILEAERNNDENLIDTYKNFWTLTSLNPSAEVRRNLFRFLNKWGMTISKSGLFVGYRNVDIMKEGETPKTTIYTDNHSHKTTIKIGQTTSIPIKECDQRNDVECSRGLMCSPLGK